MNDNNINNTLKSHTKHIRPFIARCALILLLICYQPVVEGYLHFYIITGNPIILFLRQSGLGVYAIIVLAAIVGKCWGWLTAPFVTIVSGIWYAFAEVGFKGDRDFEENIFAVFFVSIILALPIGILVSFVYRKRYKKFNTNAVDIKKE